MVEFEDILHTVFYFNDDIFTLCFSIFAIARLYVLFRVEVDLDF